MSKFVNYYQILEIEPLASSGEIRQAIKKRRSVWSTRSSTGGATGDKARRIVEQISEAEKILLDAGKRAEYDKELARQNAPDNDSSSTEGKTDWQIRAEEYLERGDLEMARSAIKKAVRLQPDSGMTWITAGYVYLRLDDVRAATEAAREAILLDDRNPHAYILRGNALFQAGQIREAVEQYEEAKARSYDPKTAQGRLAICSMCLVEEEVFNAVEEFVTLEDRANWFHYGITRLQEIYSGLDEPIDELTGVYNEKFERMQAEAESTARKIYIRNQQEYERIELAKMTQRKATERTWILLIIIVAPIVLCQLFMAGCIASL